MSNNNTEEERAAVAAEAVDDANTSSSSASDDASDIAIADKDLNDDEELQATPGHLHALANRTSPARLLPKVHSDSKLLALSPGAAQRRRSATRSVNSSRSSSPFSGSVGLVSASDNIGKDTISNNNTPTNTNNNIHASSAAASYASSSLDGKFDPDLLLDRLGFIDLDPPLPHEIRCGPLAAPGSIDGKSNNAGGLTPVNERLSEETLDDCHAFQDLVIHTVTANSNNNVMSSTMSMPSVAHSSLSGMRSDMSVGSIGSASYSSFTKGASSAVAGGAHSREGSVTGASLVGDGELSVLLGTLDEVGEEEEGSVG